MESFRIVSLLSCCLLACSPPPDAALDRAIDLASLELVDLSHEFAEDTLYWPTASPFVLEQVFSGATERGFFYEANRFGAAEHGGTHLDAPIHFGAGRETVHEIALDRLVGPGLTVDVEEACRADANYAIGVPDLQRWESLNGTFPDGAIVLLRTGYSSHWPNPARYLGTAQRGEAAVPDLSFPGLRADAARWLVARKVRAVGIDTASIDPGESQLFESHRVLASANIPAFENLTNLDALPPQGFTVVALPMKIRGGSGAPLRAIALIPK